MVGTLVVVWEPHIPWMRPHRSSTSRSAVVPEEIATQMAGLRVGVKENPPGYRRELFGPAWFDEDRNGCDTRNDILRRDLVESSMKGEGCLVASGTLHDPYTGRDIDFSAGKESRRVQIDHVVALADAWSSGASRWTSGRRRAFANDPENLLAVDGPTNEAKGADDASAWLPPREEYRCAYVVRQIRVKARYDLTVTAPERTAMLNVLATCRSPA
ncbi:HNH endonuclease family protein [uncultured Kocuria sp.]|uniref:HNH endonuclease family protein n=1 Tax=uncultured Kocuria sp. TaxID=259305 RepID=UPI002598925B|nr:HNH endonuclease family protein [uncultured Kocuria sp.]